MLDAIQRLRDCGRLVAYSARSAGRDVARSPSSEGRSFNRGWRGAMRSALQQITRQIHDIRAECDHDWDESDVSCVQEVSLIGTPMDRHHEGVRVCRECGARERAEVECCHGRD